MKPYIEKVSHDRDFTWRVQHFACKPCNIRFEWHYHLEYEVVLLRDSEGQLFAGDYIGPFKHNTLAMYGPRLPHTTTTSRLINGAKHNDAYVMWFSHEWITKLIDSTDELQGLNTLLSKSGQGILFSPETAETVFQLLSEFETMSPMQQLIKFVEVLCVLTESPQQKPLTAFTLSPLEDNPKELKTVEKASRYLENNYHKPIQVEDMGELLHMSKSSVYRLFERHFGDSFASHLKQYRIGKACELLVNSKSPISLISEQVGFNNLSNFNRHFKCCKQMTPKQFRAIFS